MSKSLKMGIYTEPKKQNNIKESESKSLKMGILYQKKNTISQSQLELSNVVKDIQLFCAKR